MPPLNTRIKAMVGNTSSEGRHWGTQRMPPPPLLFLGVNQSSIV